MFIAIYNYVTIIITFILTTGSEVNQFPLFYSSTCSIREPITLRISFCTCRPDILMSSNQQCRSAEWNNYVTIMEILLTNSLNTSSKELKSQ